MQILFLQKRLLFPTNTGGKIRSLNILKHLAQWHDVTYVSNILRDEEPYKPAMQALGLAMESVAWSEYPRLSVRFLVFALRNLLLSRFPLNVDKDFDRRLRARVDKLLHDQQFDLLICDFVQMARNAVGFDCPSVLFQHNVEAEIFSRMALTSRWPFSSYLRMQAARMAKFEAFCGSQFTRVIAVSPRDQSHFENVYQLTNVRAIETAVDTSYFSNQGRAPALPPQILFVGSMDWQPNRHGIKHFAQSILPLIRGQFPTAELIIVGRNPPADVRSLEQIPGVRVTGTVEDTRPYLGKATVSIVPLYVGGGTRLKIFEAMASGVPVVSTTLGAEGLALENRKQLLIADSDEEFAQSVKLLLSDLAGAQAMADRASQYVHSKFGSEVVARQFEAICSEAIEAFPHRRTR